MPRFLVVPVPKPWPKGIGPGPMMRGPMALRRWVMHPALAGASANDIDGLILLFAALLEMSGEDVSDDPLVFVRPPEFDGFVAGNGVEKINGFDEKSIGRSEELLLRIQYSTRRRCHWAEEEEIRVLEVGEVLVDPFTELPP